jgi:cytochrome P450/glutathione S-transferase
MYRLISIRISPFCELARWVLELQGIPYRESCHAPLLSFPFTWTTDRSLNVPVILAPDRTSEVRQFLTDIDNRARADEKILPLGSRERQDAADLIDRILNELAISVRQYAYANMLPNRKVTSALMIVRAPWPERVFVKWFYPVQAWAMRKALKINPTSVEQSRRRILESFDELSKTLVTSRSFLIGDHFSAVDLVFAAATAPLTVPPEYGAPFPAIEDMPPAMQETVQAVRSTSAGRHALRIYHEYRKLHEIPGSSFDLGKQRSWKRLSSSLERWFTGPAALRLASRFLRLSPVLRVGKITLISSHSAVTKAFDDDQKYTIAKINASRMDRISGPFMLGMDRSAQFDAENSAIHSVVKLADLDWVRRIVSCTADSLISAARPDRRLDVAGSFARVSAARVVAEYFGVPGPTEAALMRWMRSLFWDVFLNRTDLPAVRMAADKAAAELRVYLTALIAERTAQGASGNDILSRLIRAGTLDPDGIRRNITGIIVGAIDTTVTAVANIFAVLLDRPAALAETRSAAERDDKALLLQCVYEALRFSPQTSAVLRFEQSDGNTALLLTIAAMFDPQAFPDPERFATNRPLDRYLHFGHGMHTCYGRMINDVQLPALVGAVVQLPNLRRASGRFRPLQYEGPFPDRLAVEFGGPQ